LIGRMLAVCRSSAPRERSTGIYHPMVDIFASRISYESRRRPPRRRYLRDCTAGRSRVLRQKSIGRKRSCSYLWFMSSLRLVKACVSINSIPLLRLHTGQSHLYLSHHVCMVVQCSAAFATSLALADGLNTSVLLQDQQE